ncbi:MAG: hypothetical protein MJZ50_00765 [Treponema sp.]|nr:hypothetical protein [Treponema sp.]
MKYYDDAPIETMSDDEDNMVFHYKKGSFRAHESKEVRDMAEGRVNAAPGLFKSLVSTTGNKLTFIAMIICFVVVCMLAMFSRDYSDTAGGVRFSVSAFSFEDRVYASLELKAVQGKNVYGGNYSVLLECIDNEGNVYDKYETATAYSEGMESLHWICGDYDSRNIRATVSWADGESRVLVCGITHK